MVLLLLIPLAMLVVSLSWFAVYEVASFFGVVPTISSLVRPIIHSHMLTSVFILMLSLGFIAALVYDWFLYNNGAR